jgi:hypothetical protein
MVCVRACVRVCVCVCVCVWNLEFISSKFDVIGVWVRAYWVHELLIKYYAGYFIVITVLSIHIDFNILIKSIATYGCEMWQIKGKN